MVRGAFVLLVTTASALLGQPASPPSSQPTSAPTSQPLTTTLTVEIKDLRSAKGNLIFGVFRSAQGFPNRGKDAVAWEVRAAKATDGGGRIVFTASLPPGTYAASVLHDENRSGDMDKGLGGIPKEGYGVTNNPKPRFRAATFAEAAFELPPQGAARTIDVQYF